MSLALYTDVHIPLAITTQLIRRSIDVVTAQEDGGGTLPDPLLLDRATLLGRVLVTEDKDFLIEVARRQALGKSFGGVIFCNRSGMSIGKWFADIELIAKVYEPAECVDQIIHVPL